MKIILNVSKGKAFALLNVILTLALISVILLGMFKIISGNIRRNKIIREELSIYSTNFEEDLLTKVNIYLKEDNSLCFILINEDKEITINENYRIDYNKAKNKI
ncbi:MAG: hypothetical protein GX275_11180, partial [Clostridiales bacterium]|nr:hypothetical protein [Clostridiales bacterium]